MKGDKIYYRKGYKYQLARTYSIQTDIYGYDIHTEFIDLTPEGLLTIKQGYAWDGASGPTRDTPSSMRGSLIHDGLYQLIREAHLPASLRERADQYLKEICLEDEMLPERAEVWFIMVREFAGPAAESKNDRKIIVAP